LGNSNHALFQKVITNILLWPPDVMTTCYDYLATIFFVPGEHYG
jgi:hypothetical protein